MKNSIARECGRQRWEDDNPAVAEHAPSAAHFHGLAIKSANVPGAYAPGFMLSPAPQATESPAAKYPFHLIVTIVNLFKLGAVQKVSLCGASGSYKSEKGES